MLSSPFPFHWTSLTSATAMHAPAPNQIVVNGLGAWQANLWQDMVIQWQIFVPVQCFNFTINPPHLRILFLATAGFVFVMALSFLHGDGDEEEGTQSDKAGLALEMADKG